MKTTREFQLVLHVSLCFRYLHFLSDLKIGLTCLSSPDGPYGFYRVSYPMLPCVLLYVVRILTKCLVLWNQETLSSWTPSVAFWMPYQWKLHLVNLLGSSIFNAICNFEHNMHAFKVCMAMDAKRRLLIGRRLWAADETGNIFECKIKMLTPSQSILKLRFLF